MPRQETSEGRRLKTVANALRLLQILADHGDPVGISELARQMSLGKSTVHLLLQTLTDAGFTKVEGGLYSLGIGAFEVGAAALEHLKLGAHLDPPMERLAERSQEAVSLAVRSGGDAVIVKRFESSQILRAEIRLGTRMPLHSSASGKCLLAMLPQDEIDAIFPADTLPKVSPKTLTRKEELRAELERTRRQGYAINTDEFVIGVTAVAVPVPDRDGHGQAALSIAGPSARFDPHQWLDPLLRTAEEMAPAISVYVSEQKEMA